MAKPAWWLFYHLLQEYNQYYVAFTCLLIIASQACITSMYSVSQCGMDCTKVTKAEPGGCRVGKPSKNLHHDMSFFHQTLYFDLLCVLLWNNHLQRYKSVEKVQINYCV